MLATGNNRVFLSRIVCTIALSIAIGVGLFTYLSVSKEDLETSYVRSVDQRRAAINASFRVGVTGPPGARGKTGGQGPVGPPGEKGLDGDVGDQGERGDQGLKGSTGDAGLISPQGPRGPNGTKGLVGNTGSTGDQGPPGLQGIKGIQGPYNSSATGDAGPAGEQGYEGTRGDTGPQGSVGATGATGNPGPRGLPGARGSNGSTGDPGNGGPRGPMGSDGPQGTTGPIIFQLDWIYGDGRDGDLVVGSGEVQRLYRDVYATSLTVAQGGRLQNPDGYRIYAQQGVTINGVLESRYPSGAGYQPGIGGHSDHMTGGTPTGSGCTTKAYGTGGYNTSTVERCSEWDYWLRVPHFIDMATSAGPGGRFATGGGAGGGGASLWEAFYNQSYCEANSWDFCGGPGGISGGFVYITAPRISGNGTIDVQGGNGTTVQIGGYGGGGGGGGVVVLHTLEPATALVYDLRGGNGGISGRDFNDTALPTAPSGTNGSLLINAIRFDIVS